MLPLPLRFRHPDRAATAPHATPHATPHAAVRAASSTLALALATLLGACGGGGVDGIADSDGTTLGTLTLEEDLPRTTVQGAGPVAGGVLPAVLPALPLDIESSEAYATGEYDYVTAIVISALSLAVTPNSEDAAEDTFEDGMPDDLSFLGKLDLYVVATFDGEQQKALLGGLAENDPKLDPDRAARTLDLDMTGVDILRFVEADDGYEVRMEVNGNLPPDNVTFDGEVEYRVGLGFR